jgi:hypothetical protein
MNSARFEDWISVSFDFTYTLSDLFNALFPHSEG